MESRRKFSSKFGSQKTKEISRHLDVFKNELAKLKRDLEIYHKNKIMIKKFKCLSIS